MVCGNSLQGLNVSPDKIMPNTVVIQYGFQVGDSFNSSLPFHEAQWVLCINKFKGMSSGNPYFGTQNLVRCQRKKA
jgi:hypothetical protein